ncbi:hypothetical protein F4780DRAFT_494047 [Xylariomycetidae sp. FL0641]|nr:hypothetical protein F4780DRAFT_494047 [Xylariomycetidae sp. FL0641]
MPEKRGTLSSLLKHVLNVPPSENAIMVTGDQLSAFTRFETLGLPKPDTKDARPRQYTHNEPLKKPESIIPEGMLRFWRPGEYWTTNFLKMGEADVSGGVTGRSQPPSRRDCENIISFIEDNDGERSVVVYARSQNPEELAKARGLRTRHVALVQVIAILIQVFVAHIGEEFPYCSSLSRERFRKFEDLLDADCGLDILLALPIRLFGKMRKKLLLIVDCRDIPYETGTIVQLDCLREFLNDTVMYKGVRGTLVRLDEDGLVHHVNVFPATGQRPSEQERTESR